METNETRLYYFPTFDESKYPEDRIEVIKEAYYGLDELLWKYRKKGYSKLIEYLIHDTDYLTAPASTKYHGNYAGGLIVHSYGVYKHMMKIIPAIMPELLEQHEMMHSIVMCAAFHDICKCNMYEYDEVSGRWSHNEKLKVGFHGPKSVFILQKFLILKNWEAAAIMTHMGAYESKTCAQVYEEYPLAWFLHVADEASAYLDKE